VIIVRKNRIVVVFITVMLLAAVAVGAWVAGSRIRSPAEIAAQTAPPTPSPILVPVEQRVLSSEIVARGSGRFGLPQPISLAPSTLKAKAGLITTVPLPNTEVKDGDVMLTASGRPVFVLQGRVPAYRDLVPGISGADVKQLEEGLARLKFDPGPVDGVFDEQTSAAVVEWYKSSGWEPFGPTPEQIANVRTLEQNWSDAIRNQVKAAAAAAAAALPVESVRATAELANKTAAEDVEAKIAARDKAVADLANAERAIEAARATADHKSRLAAADLAAKNADRVRLIPKSKNQSPLAVDAARTKADEANKAAAAAVAAKIADRALIVLDPRSLITSRMAADANLELARASSNTTRMDGELAVHNAERDARLAVEQFELAEASVKAAQLEGEVLVQAALSAHKLAERDCKTAEAKLESSKTAAKIAQLDGRIAVQAALDSQKVVELDAQLAAKQVERLANDLQIAQRKVGVQVPVDEIVFLPALPVRVAGMTAAVGDAATGPLMTVTDFQLSVDTFLTLESASFAKEGMDVTLDEPSLGIEAKGVVNILAQEPGTRGADGYHRYAEIRITQGTRSLVGQSFRLRIPFESTKGDVIAVPASAVTQTADGTCRVQVQRNGTLEYVVVKPGLSAQGFVEITPVDGTLEPGQFVVIGYETNDKSGSADPTTSF
jgi:putative peptidoglycan binding protein